MATILSTWMYSTAKDDKVLHSQTGIDSDNQKVQNLYWRCVFCLFASSLSMHGHVRHLLFVNRKPPGKIDGIDTEFLSKKLGIEYIILDSWTRPPEGYSKAWNTQFAILDIIDWLTSKVDPSDTVLCLDADCIFTQPVFEKLSHLLKSHQALLYSMDYQEDHDINGLTRRELASLSQEYSPEVSMDKFVYSGGEFFCCRGAELQRIGPLARKAYQQSLQRFADGNKRFLEEAHLLSFVYHQLGYSTHTANDLIKRIWTDRRFYTNIVGDESRLPIWHLPAEKTHGFKSLFRKITQPDANEIQNMNLKKMFRLNPQGFWSGLIEQFRQILLK